MRVLFFALLKDATNCESVELVVPSPVKMDKLWKILIEKFPALANHQKTVRLARNGEYAAQDDHFSNDDEVALIPPVSGG